MPQPTKKRRSRWAVLAAGALIASLLAVTGGAAAAPVTAGDGNKAKQDQLAATTACVGDATADKMFPDVSEGHAFRAAINCLAYYGITIGYADGTFKPNDSVANAEMVLFMQRAAAAAGADAAKVVGDFATTGSDPVTRAHMALLIARLVESATSTGVTPVNVVNSATDGTFTFNPAPGASNPIDHFADARRTLDRVNDSAVSVLYEMGVTNGKADGTFGPADTLSRGAMAAFITRALAHTTARPAGVTIQELASGGAKVSVRNDSFRPVGNAPLDLISIATSNIARAFKSDGSCNTSQLTDASGGSGGTKCAIDYIDPVTAVGTGDYDQAVTPAAGGTTLWAWTGKVGDKINKDSPGVAKIELTKTSPTRGSNVKVTTSQPTGITRNKFGSTVTVTLQLVNGAGASAPNAVPTAAQRALSHRVVTNSCSTLNSGDQPGQCEAGSATSVNTSAVSLDATGKATFTVTGSDPDTDDTGETSPDWVTVSYSITLGTSTAVTPALAVTDGTSLTGNVYFTDGGSVVTTVSVSTPTAYAMVPASGKTGNTAVVTVTDQYGNGMAGQGVILTGSSNSDYPTVARSTGMDGKIRIGYAHNTTAETESITATVTISEGNTVSNQTAHSFYWVQTGDATGSGLNVVAGDLEKNEIVVLDGDTPELVRYDANDQFTVTDANPAEDTDVAGYGMATFEAWLAKDPGVTPMSAPEQTLSWGGYDATDSGAVTNWTISGSNT